MIELIEQTKKEFKELRSGYYGTDEKIWRFIEQSVKKYYQQALSDAIKICNTLIADNVHSSNPNRCFQREGMEDVRTKLH